MSSIMASVAVAVKHRTGTRPIIALKFRTSRYFLRNVFPLKIIHPLTAEANNHTDSKWNTWTDIGFHYKVNAKYCHTRGTSVTAQINKKSVLIVVDSVVIVCFGSVADRGTLYNVKVLYVLFLTSLIMLYFLLYIEYDFYDY
jgi:hypothetical protein